MRTDLACANPGDSHKNVLRSELCHADKILTRTDTASFSTVHQKWRLKIGLS